MKQFGNFALDFSNECLWSGSTQIALQPKPFAVLRYLVEHPGRLITHRELLDAIWPQIYVQPQVLRTYMLELRKILGDDPGQPRYIQTLPKRGYCFISLVSEKAVNAPDSVTAGCSEQAGLFDRDQERAKLSACFQSALSGQRQIVFLTGETGIGKSALIDAFTHQIGHSIITGRGHCVPGEGREEDFYPVMEALGRLCNAAEHQVVCRALARAAPAWLSALGRGACADTAIPAEPGDRMPGSLCAALEEISAIKPLLLVIEDLQWADSATLKWMAALARRREPARLMIVATYRPRSAGSDHPVKALRNELLRQQLADDVIVGPLPKPVILKLLCRELHTAELPEDATTYIHERAEGNPAFALAVLRHLIAQKLLLPKGANGTASWTAVSNIDETAGVPDELAQIVELELERLSDHDQRLLEAGSLMPVAFPAWAVAAAIHEDPCETEEACEALARRCSLVQRAGADELPDGSTTAFYAFTHGLFREVLYHRQAATRRSQRHVRIAERLGQLFSGREWVVAREMAMHFVSAGNWRHAVQALQSAVRYAMERGAYEEATELLERALRIAGDRVETQKEVVTMCELLAGVRQASTAHSAGKGFTLS